MRAPLPSPVRRFLVAALGAALAAGAAAERPAFVGEPLRSPHRARVAAVAPAGESDVVVLDGGLEEGLAIGMVCRVVRGGERIGRVILVASRRYRSAGLILGLAEGAAIRAGDIAEVKTLQSS